MIETSVFYLCQQSFVPAVHKLVLHLPHIHILGKHHCVNSHLESFKRLSDLYDVLFYKYYAELVSASFSHQTQSKYYDVNIYVSIEVVPLEYFSASNQ